MWDCLPDEIVERLLRLAAPCAYPTAARLDQQCRRVVSTWLKTLAALHASPFCLPAVDILCGDAFDHIVGLHTLRISERVQGRLNLLDVQHFASALAVGGLGGINELIVVGDHFGGFNRHNANGGNIGDAGALAIAGAAASGTWSQLVQLDLSANLIGDAGMAAIGRAAAKGGWRSLTVLRLDHNPYGERGVEAFAKAVAGSPLALARLTALQLQGQKRSDDGAGAKALARAVGASLRSLGVLVVPDRWETEPELRAACLARGVELL